MGSAPKGRQGVVLTRKVSEVSLALLGTGRSLVAGDRGLTRKELEMSVYVVRAFVKLRELLSSNRELARRFAQLEARLDKKLTQHDEAIAAILSAIRQRMNPLRPKRRQIGFTADLEERC
jgi:hypothetical protein